VTKLHKPAQTEQRRTVRFRGADSPRKTEPNSQDSECADSPREEGGRSAGQRKQTVNSTARSSSCRTSRCRCGQSGRVLRTVRQSPNRANCEHADRRGRSGNHGRTVRRQSTETDRTLNQIFKPSPNSKSIQMNSDAAQNSGTEPLQHHEGNPKRSSPKDRSFIIKIQKSELNLGFSQKWEIEGFFKRNRFQPNEHPR
jgi:hypothetical protein